MEKSGIQSAAELRNAFVETNAMLLPGNLTVQDPPIHALRVTKACATLFMDLSGCLISLTDPFRNLKRFAQLKLLSLHNCGMMEILFDLVIFHD
jgi:hypothetical protein